MKTRNLIIILWIVIFASCKKEGHVYQAIFYQHQDHHIGSGNEGQPDRNLTSFFDYADRNDHGAKEWYKNTDHYKEVIAESDSFDVKYWGTQQEWYKN